MDTMKNKKNSAEANQLVLDAEHSAVSACSSDVPSTSLVYTPLYPLHQNSHFNLYPYTQSTH